MANRQRKTKGVLGSRSSNALKVEWRRQDTNTTFRGMCCGLGTHRGSFASIARLIAPDSSQKNLHTAPCRISVDQQIAIIHAEVIREEVAVAHMQRLMRLDHQLPAAQTSIRCCHTAHNRRNASVRNLVGLETHYLWNRDDRVRSAVHFNQEYESMLAAYDTGASAAIEVKSGVGSKP